MMQIMTRIGAVCLITIACWIAIEVLIQFLLPRHGGSLPTAPYTASYRWKHSCRIGIGELPPRIAQECFCKLAVHVYLHVPTERG